jgi:hypothetical protein
MFGAHSSAGREDGAIPPGITKHAPDGRRGLRAKFIVDAGAEQALVEFDGDVGD